MALHVVYVANFGEDCIEVSDRVPAKRPMAAPPGCSIPCFRGFNLTQLRIEVVGPPVLPDGDLTAEQYQEWRSILDPDSVSETAVDSYTLACDGGGMCVGVRLHAVDSEVYGNVLEATVTNAGPYPIGKVEVLISGQWDKPRERGEIGLGHHFVAVASAPTRLLPGESRLFALMNPALKAALSYAAVLDTEQFHLTVNATLPGEETYLEIYRIPGNVLAFMLGQFESLLETEGQ